MIQAFTEATWRIQQRKQYLSAIIYILMDNILIINQFPTHSRKWWCLSFSTLNIKSTGQIYTKLGVERPALLGIFLKNSARSFYQSRFPNKYFTEIDPWFLDPSALNLVNIWTKISGSKLVLWKWYFNVPLYKIYVLINARKCVQQKHITQIEHQDIVTPKWQLQIQPPNAYLVTPSQFPDP
jgi:hypothetical protein